MRVVRHWLRYRTGEPTGRYRTELDAKPVGAWDDVIVIELLNLLNVLGILVELAPKQHSVLDLICQAHRLTVEELITSGAILVPSGWDSPLLAESPQGTLPL